MNERAGVGCSQLAAIFDAHEFLTSYKLWAILTGRMEPERGRYTAAGHLYEPAIRDYYLETHPGRNWDGSRADYHDAPLWHATAPLSGHPDGVITTASGARWVGDVKIYVLRGMRTSTIPVYVEYQMRGYMSLLDCSAAQVVVCWGLSEDGSGKVYEPDVEEILITRDLDIERWMIDRLGEWWERHVVGDVAPVAVAADVPVMRRSSTVEGKHVVLDDHELVGAAERFEQSVGLARESDRLARAHRADSRPHEAILRQALGDAASATVGPFNIWRGRAGKGDALKVTRR